MAGETNIVDIQEDARERALADSYFSDITVLSDREGDITSKINVALGLLTAKAAKLGACVVVLQPTGSDAAPNAPGGPMRIELVFRVLENPVLNLGASGTGKHALAICRRLVRLFKNYIAGGLAQGFVCEKPCIVPANDPIAPMAYEVRFWTVEGDYRNAQYLQVSMPTITRTNPGVWPAQVTLACTTAEAAIYYTLDGKHPRSGGASSVLYAGGSVAVQQNQLIRAAAYLAPSYIASDVATAIYS